MSTSDSNTQPRKRGRRAGDAQRTREAILDAALRVFARDGYTGTSVRSIARAANVDPALITHHFGAKEALFIAAHRLPDDPATFINNALGVDRINLGYEIARMFLSRFLDDERGVGISIIRSAAADPAAAHLLRDLLTRSVSDNAVALIGDHPDAMQRASLISAVLVGTVFHSQILHVETLTDLDPDELARHLAPALQALLE